MTIATEPTPKRWTKAEYHSLMDWFGEDQLRYELIDGEIIQMPPQRDEHAFAIRLVDHTLRRVFKKGYVFAIQSPMNLSTSSEPEPDILVTKGEWRNISKHPKNAVLIIEVAVGSLRYDRQTKGSLYASKGIQEYWVVNVQAGALEVYRNPIEDDDARFGFAYAEMETLKPGETITPLAAPRAKIKVANLLP